MKKRIIIIFIIVFVISITVYAANILFDSADVAYDNKYLITDANDDEVESVQDTIDALKYKIDTEKPCPPGYRKNSLGTMVSNVNNYYQCIDESADIICQRAATLHTETCNNTYCGTSGSTITYGNSTITPGTLTTGDAFDCDVNQDGEYDSASERFYFISSRWTPGTSIAASTFDSNTAVLVYYQNSGTAGYSSPINGPATARNLLPKTKANSGTWRNDLLASTTRAIICCVNSTGCNSSSTFSNDSKIAPSSFSYSGYAARLLTYPEFHNAGCGSTGSNPMKCQFLFENTNFTDSSMSTYHRYTWLETTFTTSTKTKPSKAVSYFIKDTSTPYPVSSTMTATTAFSVRPVIEIPITKIAY